MRAIGEFAFNCHKITMEKIFVSILNKMVNIKTRYFVQGVYEFRKQINVEFVQSFSILYRHDISFRFYVKYSIWKLDIPSTVPKDLKNK